MTADTGATRSLKPQILVNNRRRRVFLRLGIGAMVVVLLGGAAGVVLVKDAYSVRDDLRHVMDDVQELRSELNKGDHLEARETLGAIRENTSSARLTTTSPLWTAASITPLIGPNLRAMSEVTVSADDVATMAVAPLVDRYDSLDWRKLSPTDGRIDVAHLKDVAPSISSAASTVQQSYSRLSDVKLDGLLPQVSDPIRSVTEQLGHASTVLGAASSAAELLPPMLGADGPRTYLVLVQNSAEARATGGIPGALAILHTDDGRVTLGEQSSASKLGAYQPPIEVDPEQEALYTIRLGTQMQNVNLTPDFPTAAATAKHMWEERHPDQSVDGVLALDPVVLKNLIGATGPVDVTDPEVLGLIDETSLPASLTEDNVVSTLLSDVYKEIEDPAAQDAYFSAVAGQVFAAFTEGKGDSAGLIKALRASTQDKRLYVWSSRSSEQTIIASTALAGSVVGAATGGASFGVYFNDGTGAKMDYYALRTAQLVQTCQSSGYSSYAVRMTVTNNAPEDAATVLPTYVTGGGVFGVEPGRIRTNYVFYGPAQAFAETASVNGQPVPIGAGKHGQRPVGTVTLELAPGETAELNVVFSKVVQDSDPKLHVTPGLESSEKVIIPAKRAICP